MALPTLLRCVALCSWSAEMERRLWRRVCHSIPGFAQPWIAARLIDSLRLRQRLARMRHGMYYCWLRSAQPSHRSTMPFTSAPDSASRRITSSTSAWLHRGNRTNGLAVVGNNSPRATHHALLSQAVPSTRQAQPVESCGPKTIVTGLQAISTRTGSEFSLYSYSSHSAG
jgi:hypothetical protein